MSRRMIALALALIAPTVLHSNAPAPEGSGPTPALVARLQPFEKLFDEARFLAEKFGQPGAAKDLEAKLLQLLGIDDLAATGIDPKKPMGAYVFLAPDWSESTFVTMFPVKDDKAVLNFVGKFEVKAEKIEENFYSLAIPNLPLPTFVRFANGYAYVSAIHRESLTPERLMPPSRVFAGAETAALAINIRPDQIPEAVQKTVNEGIAEWIKESADDEDSELTKSFMRLSQKWVEMFAQDSRDAVARVNFDRTSGELVSECTITPKPGTGLATEVAAYRPMQSLFTKMAGPPGALNYAANWALEGEVRKSAVKMFREGSHEIIERMNMDIEDEKAREEVRNLFKELAASWEAGHFNAAITLRPGDKHYTGLAGVKLKDGKKVEEQFKKVVAALPEEQRKKFKLAAEKVGDYSVHSVVVDGEKNEVFGDQTFHFAFRDDAVVGGVGENAAKMVGETLASLSLQPAPLLQIDVTAPKLKALCDTIQPGVYDIVRKVIGTDDRVRIMSTSIEGGATLKATASISLQLLVGISLGSGPDGR